MSWTTMFLSSNITPELRLTFTKHVQVSRDFKTPLNKGHSRFGFLIRVISWLIKLIRVLIRGVNKGELISVISKGVNKGKVALSINSENQSFLGYLCLVIGVLTRNISCELMASYNTLKICTYISDMSLNNFWIFFWKNKYPLGCRSEVWLQFHVKIDFFTYFSGQRRVLLPWVIIDKKQLFCIHEWSLVLYFTWFCYIT